jgi:3-phenylpropionate/cinnamic acid dioxygenase small subunit
MNMTHLARAGAMALLSLVAACGSAPGGQTSAVQNYVDRQAIETTLVRYSTGLDTFDPDLYASAFTEDAEFTMENKVYRGRDEIRKIIADMKASRAARLADADPANDPPPIMHHVMTNAVIDITSADTARHHCYWMTVAGGPAMNSFRVAAEGRYEDELVKRDGQWLIHRRKILE